MEIKDLLPIVVPGVIIQLLIMAYYIKHCWENNALSQKQKAGYIIAIAIFNIPAAAVYLFSTRKKSADTNEDYADLEVDSQIRQGIFVLLIVAFEIFALRIISQNIQNPYYSLIIGLLGTCFVVIIINGLLVKRRHLLLYYLLPALQILLVIPVEYLDSTFNAQFIVLVVIASIINGFPLRLVKFYSLGSFCLYVAITVAKALRFFEGMLSDDSVSYIYVNVIVFLLVFITFYTLKKQLLANKRLEAALVALKEQSLQLEQMSAVKERNRIAGEIHDNVGHTLTSAVIAIEAGEKLLAQNSKEALEKFSLAKKQVKRGLDDIRSSVRAIQKGAEKAFVVALEELLESIHQNTGLTISHIVELSSELLPIQKHVLLGAVKECATNSLKHGESTQADLLVQEYKGSVRMTFSDNGKGTDGFRFGFGLQNIAARVQSLGGTMATHSTQGEGFSVSINIPMGAQTEGEST